MRSLLHSAVAGTALLLGAAGAVEGQPKAKDRIDAEREVLLQKHHELLKEVQVLRERQRKLEANVTLEDVPAIVEMVRRSIFLLEYRCDDGKESGGTCTALRFSEEERGPAFDATAQYFATNNHVLSEKDMTSMASITIGKPPFIKDADPKSGSVVRFIGADVVDDVSVFSVPKTALPKALSGLSIHNLQKHPVATGTQGLVVGYPEFQFRAQPVSITDTNTFIKRPEHPPRPVFAYTVPLRGGSSGSPLIFTHVDVDPEGKRTLSPALGGINSLGYDGLHIGAAFTSDALRALLMEKDILRKEDLGPPRVPDEESTILEKNVLSHEGAQIFDAVRLMAKILDSMVTGILVVGAGTVLFLTRREFMKLFTIIKNRITGRKSLLRPKPQTTEPAVADECFPGKPPKKSL